MNCFVSLKLHYWGIGCSSATFQNNTLGINYSKSIAVMYSIFINTCFLVIADADVKIILKMRICKRKQTTYAVHLEHADFWKYCHQCSCYYHIRHDTTYHQCSCNYHIRHDTTYWVYLFHGHWYLLQLNHKTSSSLVTPINTLFQTWLRFNYKV